MAIILQNDKGSELTVSEADTNIRELRDGTGAVTPAAQNTTGIQIGAYGASDYAWHDLLGTLQIDPDDPNRASWAVWRSNIRRLQFTTANAQAFVSFHLPHDYVMGSDLFVHIHWDHNSSTLTGGSTTWAFEYSYAKGHDQAAFPISKTVTVLQNASLTPYQHMIAETALTVSGGSGTQENTTLIEPDGLINARVYLDSNDLTDSVTVPSPFVHFCDIHYQSTNVGTKNRDISSGDFWT